MSETENNEVENEQVEEVEKPVDPTEKRYNSLAATLRKSQVNAEKQMKEIRQQMAELAALAGGNSEKTSKEPTKDEDSLLKKYKNELNKVKNALEEREQQAQQKQDREDVLETFNALGVTSTKVLYNHLVAEQMVYKNDDGEFVFKSEKNGLEYPLKDGLKSYLKTTEGKQFLPASGAVGSGANPKVANSNFKQPVGEKSKSDKKAEANEVLMDWAKGIMGK